MTRSMSRNPAMAARRSRQGGATLIVGLIMIVLITLIVVSAFTLSSSNLKSVGNMQVREESLAAANHAIEGVLSSPFTNAIGTTTSQIDINNDGTNDYMVAVAAPVCVKAAAASEGSPSDVELGSSMSSSGTWNTEWDIAATVTDAVSGTALKVRQGVRVLLTNTQKTLACT